MNEIFWTLFNGQVSSNQPAPRVGMETRKAEARGKQILEIDTIDLGDAIAITRKLVQFFDGPPREYYFVSVHGTHHEVVGYLVFTNMRLATKASARGCIHHLELGDVMYESEGETDDE